MDKNTLNPQQRTAVEDMNEACIIVAGPGTGKTHTLAHRLSFLIKELNTPPENILAVTFTRTAAQEMRERVDQILEKPQFSKQLWIETFHGLAFRILQREQFPFGENVPWALISEEEKISLMKDLLSKKEAKKFFSKIRLQKQKTEFPTDNLGKTYQNRLWEQKKLDFDDLFLFIDKLFKENPAVQENYRNSLDYILVDEFQDTSFAQYTFLKSLFKKNICVIGDPDQAIYSFTSDQFHPFQEFQLDFPKHSVIRLSKNYRSQSTILKAAQQVIEKNPSNLPRDMETKIKKGFLIEFLPFQTGIQEAEMIVRQIENLIGGSSFFAIDSEWATPKTPESHVGFNDIAILFRLNAQAKLFENILIRNGLPYKIHGKVNRKNGEEISAMEDMEDYQNNDNIPEGDGIHLMTLHRSKGLEFPIVFIVGCEEELLPYYNHQTDLNEKKKILEEERRLFYVGMTRAKDRLFLSHAKKRFLFGETKEHFPSPFLLDIKEELRRLQENKTPYKKKTPKLIQKTLF